MDKMGLSRDIRFRLTNLRRFLLDKVHRAREWIYKKGKGVTSKAVEDILKATSSVPTTVGQTNVLIIIIIYLSFPCRMPLSTD